MGRMPEQQIVTPPSSPQAVGDSLSIEGTPLKILVSVSDDTEGDRINAAYFKWVRLGHAIAKERGDRCGLWSVSP